MDDGRRSPSGCGTLSGMSWSVVALAAALLLPVAPGGGDRSSSTEVRVALATLHEWDAARGAAYAAGDGQRLEGLYAPGSAAGARDVAVLRSYAGHRWRITSLVTQVRSIRVLGHSAGRWRLRTVDRVRGIADTPERCRPLPAGRFRVHDLVLVRGPGGWVVASALLSPGRSPESR